MRVRALRRFLVVVCVAWGVLSDQPRSSAEPKTREAAESYALPITPPLDQGDSDLCWVYATLSMLETYYLYRHPDSRIELSRAALQLNTIADRFARLIRGEPRNLEEDGLPVEALDLIVKAKLNCPLLWPSRNVPLLGAVRGLHGGG